MAAEPPPSSSKHPATWKFGYPIYHAETRAQWRAWLAANHDSVPGVWLCSWRGPVSLPVCPYPDAVEEAICFGWIDSTVNALDERRTLQLMTPRRPKSGWTRLNRQRVERMESAGLMTAPRRRAVEVAQQNGWWTLSDSVEDLVEPEDLAKSLDADAAARAHWNSFPPSARKAMLWWVVTAAKAETRTRRIETIVARAADGERAQG
jgi:uncharacterized protein YdeI (YjbR/CyaY-like superfamily)